MLIPATIIFNKYSMRNFINMVTEAAQKIPPYVFHGTSCRSLAHIIHRDVITVSQDDNDKVGIFTSGNMNVALRYVDNDMYGAPSGGVIVLDTGKLIAAGYGIESYLYHSGTDGMEFVIDEEIHPASPYIKEIRMPKENLEILAKSLEAEGEPAGFNEDEWSREEFMAAMRSLLKYPFKII
jgi:hypothetical protein